jgi:hypothetical protein
MANRVALNPNPAISPRPPPSWARPKGETFESLDAAFLAGAGFAALDARVRANAPFDGLWRNRLALRAAVAHAGLIGRRESESELRDGFALRGAGDAAAGPADGLLKGWRELVRHSTGLNPRVLHEVAASFGLNLPDALADILSAAEIAIREDRLPLRSAAHVLSYVRRQHPRAEFLGFWIADAVLAQGLGWPLPLPLLASGLARRGGGRRGSAPGDEFGRLAIGYAEAAAAAVDLHDELARRAAKLIEAAPRLRAKGAGAVVAALLDDDALSPAARLGGMSDRGMRRLCDRLVALGAARELTGRPTFRLYGL